MYHTDEPNLQHRALSVACGAVSLRVNRWVFRNCKLCHEAIDFFGNYAVGSISLPLAHFRQLLRGWSRKGISHQQSHPKKINSFMAKFTTCASILIIDV